MLSGLDLAIYHTVHEFRAGKHTGAAALAERMGKNPGTFSNKANPAMPTHQFRGSELIEIINFTHDHRILHAIAQACNHVCIELEDHSQVSDLQLLDAYAAYHAEIGDTAQVIRQAFADGQITREEFATIDREMHEDISAMYALRARLEALVR